MLALAILIPVAYIPGLTGNAIHTGWAALSCGLPVVAWGMAKEPFPNPSYILLAIWISFFIYAVNSLSWADNPETGVSEVWQIVLMGGAFYVGSLLPDLRRVAIGLTLGFGVSSVFALAQALGVNLIPEFVPCRPSGLLFNPIILGEGCALTILLLLPLRLYWRAALLVPGLALSQSRGALLAAAVGLVLMYCRPLRATLWTLTPIWAVCSLADAFAHGNADQWRWLVWRILYRVLDFWGYGAGALDSVIIVFRDHLYRPSYAHNEFLDLTYQFGVGAILAFLVLLAPALQAHRKEWPCYVGFLICLFFSFPLHSPPLAFIGMVVAGCLCRDWSWAWDSGDIRRPRSVLQAAHEGGGYACVAV